MPDIKEPNEEHDQPRVYATRADLVSAAMYELAREELYEKALKKWIVIREMTAIERGDYEESLAVGRGRKRTITVRAARERVLLKCLINPDGTPMFAGEKDLAFLGRMRASLVDKWYDVAARLSGLTEEDEEKLGNS